MIILDTNVVSEPSQPRPSTIVIDWFAAQDAAELFTTTPTEAELLYGLALLPPGRKRDELEKALIRFLVVELEERILPFDRAAAAEFGFVAAARRKAGLQTNVFDSQIAAIARVHGAAVATRDTDDFAHSGLTIVNPWTATR